jgi:ABC-2 type transport system ATP-binding protein
LITPSNNAALSLRGLSKAYEEILAVQDLSLDILRGEVFGFLGPNGAGKTTTISMICGLLKPNAGEILILGQSQAEQGTGWKSALGLCPETLVIWEGLTCMEQLEFLGQLYDLERNVAKRRALELLEVFGLTNKRSKMASTLSGGMKRRLNIALALIHDPQILILDEPQAGLDPQSRILVREYIRSLQSEKTVILTSHEMHEVDQVADRVGIIDHGKMLALDTPEGLKNRMGAGTILEIELAPGHEEKLPTIRNSLPKDLHELTIESGNLRLTHMASLDVIPDILGVLQSAEVQVEDMSMRKATLEDVFIDLTGRSLRE